MFDNRVDFIDIDFPPEEEKRAIQLAAYNIIEELEQEGMISEEELLIIKEKYFINITK